MNMFVLMLNVPVNNFSVMLGRSHRFLVITSTFRGANVSSSEDLKAEYNKEHRTHCANMQYAEIFKGVTENDNFLMKKN